jgi:hypothetical protein
LSMMRCRAGARARETGKEGRAWSSGSEEDSLCLSSDSEWSMVDHVEEFPVLGDWRPVGVEGRRGVAAVAVTVT